MQRGRPLPALGTTEAKLQQRKLDALKRGVHRIKDAASLVYGVHLIGVGSAGAQVIERFLKEAPSDLLEVDGSRLTVLAIDIGDTAHAGIRTHGQRFDPGKSQIETVALAHPSRGSLEDSLARYVDFLKLEYPLYHPNPASTQWLPEPSVGTDSEGKLTRSIAKAIYGRAYYDGDRPMLQNLKRFAQSVEETRGDSLVCIIFGLGDSSGSGMALDLARHLSGGLLGRRVLVTGIGIEPHTDELDSTAAELHTTLSELDVLCDESKNRGITVSCGEQYRNPFTAGFILVPQPPGAGLEATREIVIQQVASLFLQRRGANLWEALRLLNWVAAPSTQHSAARTPWGARWIHMLGFAQDRRPPEAINVRDGLGLLPNYFPEFIELRTSFETTDEVVSDAWKSLLDAELSPELPTQCVVGSPEGTVQFLLPRMARTDLSLSQRARVAYDALPLAQRHAAHSLLLEHGLLLCEPSARLEGMAGMSIGEGNQWIAVPMHELNGQYDARE